MAASDALLQCYMYWSQISQYILNLSNRNYFLRHVPLQHPVATFNIIFTRGTIKISIPCLKGVTKIAHHNDDFDYTCVHVGHVFLEIHSNIMVFFMPEYSITTIFYHFFFFFYKNMHKSLDSLNFLKTNVIHVLCISVTQIKVYY